MNPIISEQPIGSIDPVLQALSLACSDAWCYLPANSRSISHWSVEFLRLFRLENAVERAATGKIELEDVQICNGCLQLGLPSDWLAEQFQVSPCSGEAYECAEPMGQMRVTMRQIRNSTGAEIGRLLLLRLTGGAGTLQSAWLRAVAARRQLSVLSERETEILELVYSGLTNKAAARQACISEKTVEKHRANIMRKLKVRSVANLIRRVTEANLLNESFASPKAESAPGS